MTGERVRAGDIVVRPRTRDDDSWVTTSLQREWGSVFVARLGELVDASALPAVIAEVGGERVGMAAFAVRGTDCELVSLWAATDGRGIGSALLTRCLDDARAAGCHRLWLITTNDNVRAFGFYQRHGLDLCALHRDGVARSRRVKPRIPLRGACGIPIAHELEFEAVLAASTRADPPASE